MLQPLGQGRRRLFWRLHHRQARQGGGRSGHGFSLSASTHHHEPVEAPLQGPLRHAMVQLHAAVPQLEHGAEHRETSAGLGRQQIKGRQHRFGGSVVGLIEHGEAALLQAAVTATGHRHIQGL